jgi:hypothetical protein
MSSTDATLKPDPKSTPPQRRPSADTAAQKSSPDAGESGQAELSTAIDQLLDAVGSKFKAMSKDIMTQSPSPALLSGAR